MFIGTDNRREKTDFLKGRKTVFKNENLVASGFIYFLPLFIVAEGRVDHKGNLRLQWSSEDLALTKREQFIFSWDMDIEYHLGLKYIDVRNLALSGNYDRDYGWGAGISFVY